MWGDRIAVRRVTYDSLSSILAATSRPASLEDLVEDAGLVEATVVEALGWLVHHGIAVRSGGGWLPMFLPREGVCWEHGLMLHKGRCPLCKREMSRAKGPVG